MKNKVILISIDGLRPDGALACGHPFVQEMMRIGSYTLDAQTVYPSVTLPSHMSMFHSVTPERHGITVNQYTPQVRPIKGLFEQIAASGGASVMYYGWETLRDVSLPGSLRYAEYINAYAETGVNAVLTRHAIERVETTKPDFVFLYLLDTDTSGHNFGWMSEGYLKCVYGAIENVREVYEAFGQEYTILVTADHGGHDRGHGSTMPEDMTIPMFFMGSRFEAGKALSDVSILDLAPTAADILGVPAAPEWEGKSLVK